MPEENRVFDVTKPKHVSPSPTSRPVIVGHQPMVSDPMVKDKDEPDRLLSHAPTKINVNDEPSGHEPDHAPELKTGHEEHEPEASSTSLIDASHEEEHKAEPEPVTGPAKFDEPVFTPAEEPEAPAGPAADAGEITAPAALPDAADNDHSASQPADPSDDIPSDSNEVPPIQPHETTPDAPPEPHHPTHIEGLHFAEPRRKNRSFKWLVIGLLALVIAVYLLLDSGLISTGINLPFHLFKQDKGATPAQSNTPAPQQSATQPVSSGLPAGFKLYSLSGTSITFAAPSAWGEPTSTTEQGYAKRGGTNQPSGNYAYLVSFATNKDVQVAVTSNQYLPPARDRLFYDYLQWCTGTNDGKYYLAVLNFTTADKIDTPSTVSCDQGPLTGATKLDSTTLLQAKAADPAGKTIGDIYTKNLTDKNLPVLRVKDAAMTNGTDIKALLGTVKSSSANP